MFGFRLGPAIASVAASAALVPATAGAAPVVGFNDPPYAHAESVNHIVGLHARLGADAQRLVIQWRFVEPTPGRLDWTMIDDSHDEALARGIRTIAIVSSAPRWAAEPLQTSECTGSDTEFCQQPPAREHLPEFQHFLRELTRRYPGLAAIEVYNEPNLGQYNWQPQADPEYYTEVLRAAHQAVKSVKPSLPVISGGITALPREPVRGAMDHQDFLRRMYAAGARDAMDGIGIHPYPADSEPAAAMNLVQQVRALRNAAGDAGKPLWVTEVGYSTVGETAVTAERQAALLPDLVRLLAAEADIRSVIVHAFRDRSGRGIEDGYGVFTTSLQPKPAAATLRTAFNEIRGGGLRAQAARARRQARRAQRQARTRAAAARRARAPGRCRLRSSRRCAVVALLR